VLWLAKLKLILVVSRFTTHYGKVKPYRNSILNWMQKFKENGSTNDRPQSEALDEETVASVEEAFMQSP
jgi:hypothetical protein